MELQAVHTSEACLRKSAASINTSRRSQSSPCDPGRPHSAGLKQTQQQGLSWRHLSMTCEEWTVLKSQGCWTPPGSIFFLFIDTCFLQHVDCVVNVFLMCVAQWVMRWCSDRCRLSVRPERGILFCCSPWDF